MKDLKGKVALVTGIANKRSISFAIAKELAGWGARLVVTFLPLGKEDEAEKFAQLTGQLKPAMVLPLDVTDADSIARLVGEIEKEMGSLGVLVHSMAAAKREELRGRFSEISAEGFLLAQRISAYSLIALVGATRHLMTGKNSSVITLTFIGSERAVKNYNVMGSAKAALESNVRYLAYELGPEGIRVNAISAGPIRTVSASGIKDFLDLLHMSRSFSALKRTVTMEEVAQTVSFLASAQSSGITGQVLFVDGGFNIYG